MPRLLFIFAALSGFLWVALGAMAGHHVFSETHASYFEKAQRYQIVHTLAILIVLFAPWPAAIQGQFFVAAAWLLGILCFSGGLYTMTLTGLESIRFIVPVGGMAFLAGWLSLAVLLWQKF